VLTFRKRAFVEQTRAAEDKDMLVRLEPEPRAQPDAQAPADKTKATPPPPKVTPELPDVQRELARFASTRVEFKAASEARLRTNVSVILEKFKGPKGAELRAKVASALLATGAQVLSDKKVADVEADLGLQQVSDNYRPVAKETKVNGFVSGRVVTTKKGLAVQVIVRDGTGTIKGDDAWSEESAERLATTLRRELVPALVRALNQTATSPAAVPAVFDAPPPVPATLTAPLRASPRPGIEHDPVATGTVGRQIEIAAKPMGITFDRLILAYRPEQAADFLARDMERDALGVYRARIPEPATRGASVAYYIEARARGGQAVANNGTYNEPYVIVLH
jgi:hypothetical protein